jgi:hypothetical protein
MKINKVKKITLKNGEVFLGSYHKAIKKSSYEKNILRAYTIKNKKISKRIVKFLLRTTMPRVSRMIIGNKNCR